ncbi:type II toxin-antitoxin system RelE/ParE family toxin [Marinobacter sp. Arc7-DN-1]|uniref:type II toxin-antitoxin system RelE/ParE family toxin n=1 Tax=Marinobacter sp. Arc7-DN-1 TaxID=2304594 RepID=UPI000E42D5B3|nr:type II toxin-antitoxin system RelE/ParE family toxin [Marinobacter sp. Arc7-DN-1]AXS81605.1 type II toxin-antitoxin system RelE/ParE family toxin [Marinobacter sp. Arc7-DN-1]
MAELNFHPSIYQEVQEAYSWYEQQAAGLGEVFIGELEAACESIRSLPETWPKFGKRTRRFLLTKFPYAVVYTPSTSTCHVVAVELNRFAVASKPGSFPRDQVD